MLVKPAWTRPLHQKVNDKAFVVEENFVYVAEKERYLTKIDLLSGNSVWSLRVSNSWGWLCIYRANLYYLEQSGRLLILQKDTGEVIKSHELKSAGSLGYIIPSDRVLITGGWRGYSDLQGYDPNTLDLLWTKKVADRVFSIDYSVPLIINDNLLLTVNHTARLIEAIELNSGIVKSSLSLPDGLQCPDLGRSFQVIGDRIIFTSTQGKLYLLNTNFQSLEVETLNTDSILTILPYFYNHKLIYEESHGNFVFYDRTNNQRLGRIRLANNYRIQVFATQLENKIFIVGGSLGQLKIVDEAGSEIAKIKSDSRISTQFYTFQKLIIYGNKSEIRVWQWK